MLQRDKAGVSSFGTARQARPRGASGLTTPSFVSSAAVPNQSTLLVPRTILAAHISLNKA